MEMIEINKGGRNGGNSNIYQLDIEDIDNNKGNTKMRARAGRPGQSGNKRELVFQIGDDD